MRPKKTLGRFLVAYSSGTILRVLGDEAARVDRFANRQALTYQECDRAFIPAD